MNRLLHIFCFILSTHVQGTSQSKLVEVVKSELTGVALPAGSKQDKRILSTAGAKTLLQMTAEENSITLEDRVEVLSLPPATKKEVKQSIQNGGWELLPVANETAYTILKNKERMVLMYLESTKKETSLYFMPVISIKEEPSTAKVVETPAQSQPQVQSQTQPQSVQQSTHVQTTPLVETKSEQPVMGQTFTFTSTNFDDGWVSTIAADFVEVKKGAMTVHIYYSIPFTDEIRNSNLEFSEYFWNKLVVPNYTVKSATRLVEPGYTYFRTYFIEGEAIHPKTGKPCYLALNVLVNSGIATPVLAIAPDKASYYQVFAEPKNLGTMSGYNKFAVSAKDITGVWEASSSAGVSLYNTYTGNYAGMNTAQSYDKFAFNADLTYTSRHSGASSVYGNNTAFTQDYKGKLAVTNWEMSMTNRWQGTTDNYNCYFEAVKGGRILHLQDKKASAIQYRLVRVQ